MQIIRYLDSNQQEKYASLQADGTAREIAGDIFGQFSVTDRRPTWPSCWRRWRRATLLCIGLNYRRHAAEGKARSLSFPSSL